MKNFNVKKVICKSNVNEYEISKHLTKIEGKLVEALEIMQSIINNPDQMDFHNRKIKLFYRQFI